MRRESLFVLLAFVSCRDGPDFRAALPRLGVLPSYRRHSTAQAEPAATYAFVDGGNKDFNRFAAECGTVTVPLLSDFDAQGPCDLNRDGLLLASSDDGPGVVGRFWMTGATVLSPPLWQRERLLVVRDGETLIDASLSALAEGRGPAALREPLVGWTSGAWLSTIPIAYDHSFRIALLEPDASKSYFFIADTTEGLGLPSPRSLEEAGAAIASQRDRAREVVEHGDSSLALEGAGTIESLTVSLSADPTSSRLAVTIDGERTIDISVLGLMAYSAGSDFTSEFLSSSTSGGERVVSLSLPLPFFQSVRVELEGASIAASVRRARPAADAGKLRAFEARAVPSSEEHVLLERAGRGKLVGVAMAMSGHHAERALLVQSPWNFLETDDWVTLDGATFSGTGTEDYFGAGFYFAGGPFQRPLAGVIEAEQSEDRARFSAYRWLAPVDVIPYEQHVRLSWEMRIAGEPLIDSLDTVVWFYE